MTENEITLEFIEIIRVTTKEIFQLEKTLSAKFEDGRVSLGRSVKNKIKISHPSIDPQESAIIFNDGRIYDNSTNGTYIPLKSF